MTRELKFRAWDKEQEQMYDESFGFSAISVLEEANELDLPVMQFTGLHDKNGTKIYEGDIVKTSFKSYDGVERGAIAQVKYGEHYVGFDSDLAQTGPCLGIYFEKIKVWGNFLNRPLNDNYCDGEALDGEEFNIDTKWEIIGNIYDNPELV